MLGLDNAGKTSVWARVLASLCTSKWCMSCSFAALVHRFTENTDTPVSPTTTFSVTTHKHLKFTLNLWDVGGQDALRPYWRHYYTGTQGILFVVDGSDESRLDLAALELRTLAADDQLVVSRLLAENSS